MALSEMEFLELMRQAREVMETTDDEAVADLIGLILQELADSNRAVVDKELELMAFKRELRSQKKAKPKNQ